MTAMNPRFDQVNFRVRVDTNTPDGGTPDWNSWTENQAAAHVIDWDTTFRVRFTIQNDGNANSTDNFYLYAAKNGGSYALVTTTSSGLQSDDASTVADGTSIATGNFLLTAGAGTAAAGIYDETGTESTTCNSGNYIEIEFGLSIDSADVVDGDYFDLRVYSDADGSGAAAFSDMVSPGTYDNTPRIEVNENLTVTATGTITWDVTLAGAGTAFDTTLRTTGVFFATAGHRFYDRSPSPFLNRGPPIEEVGGTKTATATTTFLADLATASKSRAFGTSTITGDLVATGTSNAKATITVLGEGVTDAVHLAQATITFIGDLVGENGVSFAFGTSTFIGDLAAAPVQTATGTSTITGDLVSRGTSNAKGTITVLGEGITDAVHLAQGTVTITGDLAAAGESLGGIQSALGGITYSNDLAANGTSNAKATITYSNDLTATAASNAKATITVLGEGITDAVHLAQGTITFLSEVAASGTQTASGTIALTGSLVAVGDKIAADLPAPSLIVNAAITSRNQSTISVGNEKVLSQLATKTATVNVAGTLGARGTNIAADDITSTPIIVGQHQPGRDQSVLALGKSGPFGINRAVASISLTADLIAVGVQVKPQGTITVIGSLRAGPGLEQIAGSISVSGDLAVRPTVTGVSTPVTLFIDEVPIKPSYVWLLQGTPPSKVVSASISLDSSLSVGDDITQFAFGTITAIGSVASSPEGVVPAKASVTPVTLIGELSAVGNITIKPASGTITVFGQADSTSGNKQSSGSFAVSADLVALPTRLTPTEEAFGTITVTGKFDGFGFRFFPTRATGVARFRATLAASESQGVGTRKGAFARLRVKGSLTSLPPTWFRDVDSIAEEDWHLARGYINVLANLTQAQLSKEPCTLGRGTINVSGATMSAFGGDVNDKFVIGTISFSASLDVSAIYGRAEAFSYSASLTANGRKLPIGNADLLSRPAVLAAGGRIGPGTIDGQKQKFINEAYGSLQIYNNSQGGFYTIGGYGVTKEAFCLINFRMDMNARGETDVLKFAKGLGPMRITGDFSVANGVVLQGASMTIFTAGALSAKGDHVGVSASINLSGSMSGIGQSLDISQVSFADRTVFSFTPSPGTAIAGIRLDNNGKVYYNGLLLTGGSSNGTYAEDTLNPDDWIDPESAASSAYKVRFTRLSGSVPTSASDGYALNTWYSLNTDQYCYNTAEETEPLGIGERLFSEILVEISKDEVTILASGVVELDAQAGSAS